MTIADSVTGGFFVGIIVAATVASFLLFIEPIVRLHEDHATPDTRCMLVCGAGHVDHVTAGECACFGPPTPTLPEAKP